LEANWGPAYRGKVRLEAAPLSADNQGFLRQLVTQVLANPKDFADLFRLADWPSIFDAVGLPQSKAAPATPSGPSAILSAVGQLQRQALEEVERTSRTSSRGEWHPSGRSLNKDLAVQSQNVHIEAVATDAMRLRNFDPNQPRDEDGKWSKDGPSATPSAVTGMMDVVDPIDGPANEELEKAKDKAQQHVKKGLEDLGDAIKKVYEGETKAFKKDFKWTLKPTNQQNARILGKNMGSRLAPGEEPHHIAPSLHPDPWAGEARSLLRYYQIDINSADNGVSLTHLEHQQSWLNRRETIKLVTRKLEAAEGNVRAVQGSEDWEVHRREIIKVLRQLAREIKAGKFPPGNPRSLPPMD
jgi:hypothetical protein